MNRFLLLGISFLFLSTYTSEVGEVIDQYNGIPVLYNGYYTNTHGRHLTSDGYNLGLKWQCVEYVKRYYYYVYGHKFPSSYGHAKDFFNVHLFDVDFNNKRGLMQYRNIRSKRPQEGDILVYGPSQDNPYGHMGIVTWVTEDRLELIQQNYGHKTRVELPIVDYKGIITVADYGILGWLRMPKDSNYLR